MDVCFPNSEFNARCMCTACLARAALRSQFPGLYQLVVSQDGQQVAFVNLLDIGSELWMAQVDGTGLRCVHIAYHGEQVLFPAFDGEDLLYFSMDGGPAPGIFRLHLALDHLEQVTHGSDWAPVPLDTRHVVYFSKSQGHLYVLDLDTQVRSRLTPCPGVYYPLRWRPPVLMYSEFYTDHGRSGFIIKVMQIVPL